MVEFRVLEQFLPPERLVAARLTPCAGGFSGAEVWRVATADGTWALRAMPVDAVDHVRLRGLHRLLDFVHAAGVLAVPVPLKTPTGDSWVVDAQRLWQMEPWQPGQADFHQHPSDAKLSAALACLARWHLAAARFVPTPAECPWFESTPSASSPGLAERLQILRSWNRDRLRQVAAALASLSWPDFQQRAEHIVSLFEQRAPHIEQQLQLGLQIAVPLQPCLRDVWHDHVLFTEDEVTGLIDPHACRRDTVATDLARLLGSLVGDDLRGWDIGLQAYQQVRPLSLAEQMLVPIFDASGALLSGMTWLDWCVIQRRAFREPARVLARLDQILQRLHPPCPPIILT